MQQGGGSDRQQRKGMMALRKEKLFSIPSFREVTRVTGEKQEQSSLLQSIKVTVEVRAVQDTAKKRYHGPSHIPLQGFFIPENISK